MVHQPNATETDATDIATDDPRLTATGKALWAALTEDDKTQLSIALQRQALLNSANETREERADIAMSRMLTANAELAYDYLLDTIEQGSAREITGTNVKHWLAQRVLGDFAGVALKHAKLEMELASLTKQYGAERLKEDSKVVISQIKPLDMWTLCEPIKDMYKQDDQSQQTEDGRKRLSEHATQIVLMTIQKAICEGKDLGSGSTEIAGNVARLLISNQTEYASVWKKLQFNASVHAHSGGAVLSEDDFVRAFQDMQANGKSPYAVGDGGFTGNSRNAPGQRGGRRLE